jgi:hypothetical protein
MASESFEDRVRQLHETWAEQRDLTGLWAGSDFASRFQLLTLLHGWAAEATKTIGRVYGASFVSAVGPPPDGSDQPPGFSVTIAGGYTARFFLKERHSDGGGLWSLSATVRTPGAAGATTTVGPDRRHRGWSRGQLEDVLLSMLAAYEREEVEGPRPKASGRRALWKKAPS